MEDFDTSFSVREIIKDKLRQNFDGKIVRKDLTKKIKEGANVPTYVLEFLLGQYCSSDDDEIVAQGVENVKRILADNFVRPDEAQKILTDKKADLDDFGRMLGHTWKLKRQTGGAITTDGIDALYQRGIDAGALGGKLLGAGGGGFLVFYVQPEKKKAVKEAMKDLLYVPFHFEDGGTRVIHYTPESYVPKEEEVE